MTAPRKSDSRLRAYAQFLAALLFYFFARLVARHGAMGIAGDQWEPLVEQAMLAFLLIFGFAGVGFSLNRQAEPVSAQGLPRRAGWTREIGLGLVIGWSLALVCVIVMVIDGGIAIGLSLSLSSWGWLIADAAYFALLTLAEEVAFRGYPFQRFARAVGSAGAVFGFSLLYAFLQAMQLGSTRASIAVSFLLGVVLSTAYLRTRALWVSWGLNFGWKASRALIFGLTVAGNSTHSPVVQGDAMGSFWLTGGGFGLDGSWFAFFVLLAAIPVVYRATRDLDFRHNAPHLPPAGIPVDLDAAARRQHEAAMGAAPAPPTLVQIAPTATPSTPAESAPPDTGNETH